MLSVEIGTSFFGVRVRISGQLVDVLHRVYNVLGSNHIIRRSKDLSCHDGRGQCSQHRAHDHCWKELEAQRRIWTNLDMCFHHRRAPVTAFYIPKLYHAALQCVGPMMENVPCGLTTGMAETGSGLDGLV